MPSELEVGQVVEGTISGIAPFGAFVVLPTGKTGLVHISEVADAYVKDIKDYLKESDKVTVKVLSMDPSGKIALSIRQALPKAQREGTSTRETPHRERRSGGSSSQPSFEDKMQRFMKDSEDRLQDLRRNTESKRGGRGASR
ncbi:MAG: S1 RNA-binding domain-containing protein [Firmicutes bacterium]|jgi:S1 RNA binding domain protein|uniref:RNA-binding protein S1 n=1 Tax=Sulfobacillus benefaciens TaxID=453960 RepID=A0A2T2X8S4_9FIRM|nr:S1 RNA-binding domain-containing protein [Bacillota bacterium]MCL5014287.1 S1 RNA-binding domain-containing protein [Bacillota bacterium]PSR30885.1 MAG: RNA-binding protein S1 [Sulfobacillus benefaciens]HBQ94051.1 RNA-binding protein S1 [Sulfobacillus sp.]